MICALSASGSGIHSAFMSASVIGRAGVVKYSRTSFSGETGMGNSLSVGLIDGELDASVARGLERVGHGIVPVTIGRDAIPAGVRPVAIADFPLAVGVARHAVTDHFDHRPDIRPNSTRRMHRHSRRNTMPTSGSEWVMSWSIVISPRL